MEQFLSFDRIFFCLLGEATIGSKLSCIIRSISPSKKASIRFVLVNKEGKSKSEVYTVGCIFVKGIEIYSSSFKSLRLVFPEVKPLVFI